MQEGPGGLAEFAGGPVLSDVGKTGYNTFQALGGKPKEEPGRGLKKQALGMAPFVGTGLAAGIGGGKGGGSGRPRLPMQPRLPSLPRP